MAKKKEVKVKAPIKPIMKAIAVWQILIAGIVYAIMAQIIHTIGALMTMNYSLMTMNQNYYVYFFFYPLITMNYSLMTMNYSLMTVKSFFFF